MLLFINQRLKQLKNQISFLKSKVHRNELRYDVIVRYQGETSMAARQMATRIKLDKDEIDSLERKIKRGGF